MAPYNIFSTNQNLLNLIIPLPPPTSILTFTVISHIDTLNLCGHVVLEAILLAQYFLLSGNYSLSSAAISAAILFSYVMTFQ